MCILAGIISLCMFHRVNGVREGTVISALLVGYVSRMYGRFLKMAIKKILSVLKKDAVTEKRVVLSQKFEWNKKTDLDKRSVLDQNEDLDMKDGVFES